MLSIDLEELLGGPRALSAALDEEWLRRELHGVMHEQGHGTASLEATASRQGDRIQVDGRLQARFEVPCGRCLEPAVITVDQPYFMVFEPAESEGDLPEELELGEADLNWQTYQGTELDLGPLVREELILAVPMQPRCREDCPGLLAGAPGPEDEGPGMDPRWKALAKLKPSR
jgi:uncharacterized protein